MGMRICFVCGNKMLEETAQILNSRVPTPMSRYDYPFFPFLEYHDPAPGAEPMSDNWTVISCQVCKAFLTQQWDSFERANFPINKRLYWLKRPSGCEIRQPVSQIELEEILNEQSKRNQLGRTRADSSQCVDAVSDESFTYKQATFKYNNSKMSQGNARRDDRSSTSKRRRDDKDSTAAGGKVRVVCDSRGSAIASHYNHLPECGRKVRTKSRIYFMRNFNNWVKSVLLKTFQDRLQHEGQRNGINALDLGCGKGGDLLKWRKGNISKLICTDIAATSIEQCQNRYEQSYKQSKGRIYRAEFLVADAAGQRLSEVYKSRSQSFDLSSCQFAIHYSFESESRATMMVRNLCENVRKGGYVIGTTVNSEVLRERLDQSDTNSFGNNVYRVSFDSADEFKDYGHRYNFHLEGVVDCHEFVLKREVLEQLAAKFGMKLVLWQTFSDFFAANSRTRENKDLLKTIKALEIYPSNNRSGDDPSDYTHAEEVISDIKERKPGSDPRVGTLSLSEWDAASLYVVFAFKKAEYEDETFDVPPSTRDDIPLLVMSS